MKTSNIFKKPNKKELIISGVGFISASILFIISFVINETKKVTSADPEALLEALHWFRISDYFYAAGMIVIAIVCGYFLISSIKNNQNNRQK